MAKQSNILKEATGIELFPVKGTNTQKLKAVGADFNRGDWLQTLVIHLLKEKGWPNVESYVDAMVGMCLGSHGFGPNKMEAEKLKGMAYGIWLAQNNMLH